MGYFIPFNSVYIIIILIFARKTSTESSENCFHPGQPINGEAFPDKSEYLKGEGLTFTCSQSYVLIGEQTIECAGNNTWSQTIPFCGQNAAFHKIPHCLKDDEGTVNDILTNLLMDGDLHTCLPISFEKEFKLIIWFQQKIHISNIYIYTKNLSETQPKPHLTAVFNGGYFDEYLKVECDLKNEDTQIEFKIFECNKKMDDFTTEVAQLSFHSPQRITMMLCDIMSFNVEDPGVVQFDLTENFKCTNTRSIPLSIVCDGILHSLDGSDESKCEHSAALIVSTSDNIRMIDMKTRQERIIADIDALHLDYFYSTGTLIWIPRGSITIHSLPVDSIQPLKETIIRDLKSPVALAVDWIYYHIYWLDEVKKTVEVADLSGHMRKVLIRDDIKSPTTIALHPMEGLMFWGDSGYSKIERCGMDGTDRQIIVNRSINAPDSIIIDFSLKRIYWSDRRLRNINSAKFDGSERKLILTSLFSWRSIRIAIYQDWIFWNSLPGRISMVDKINGEDRGQFDNNTDRYLRNFIIYHASKQPQGKNYCAPNNGNCSYLCLPSPRATDESTGFTCACPDGLTWNDDEGTCYHKEIISRYSPSPCDRSGDFHCGNSTCIPFAQVCDGNNDCFDARDELNCSLILIRIGEGGIQWINIDTKEQKIILKHLERGYDVDFLFSAGTLFWTDRYAIQSTLIDRGHAITDIINDDIFSPVSLAVDWIYFHIYWIDREKHTVEVANLEGNMRKVLFVDTDFLTDIALNPLEGFMFWSNMGRSTKIERCQMDGTHREVIINNSEYRLKGITIDFALNKIYWLESYFFPRSISIYSANFDGSQKKHISSLDLRSRISLIGSLDVYQNWIYLVGVGNNIIKIDKYNGANHSININSSNNRNSYFRNIKIYHPSKQPTGRNYCAPNNGNCSHFCFPSLRTSNQSLGFTCACPTGTTLNDDGKTCSMNHVNISTCDPPTPPPNGQIIPLLEKYFHKQHVQITCNEGFTLFGSNSTICNNGVWSNVTTFCDICYVDRTMPFCPSLEKINSKNLIYKQRINFGKNDIEFIPCHETLTDGNLSSCSMKNVSSRASLVLNLQEILIIQNITITVQFPDGINMKNNLPVMLEIWNHSAPSKHISCQYLPIDKNGYVNILCNGNSIAVQFISVIFNVIDNLPIKIQLCELTVFTVNALLRKNTNHICKTIERSPNCLMNEMIDHKGNQYMLYSPKDGYHLKGKPLRKCEKGNWSYDSPQCLNLSWVQNLTKLSSETTGNVVSLTSTNSEKKYRTSFILLSTTIAISLVAFLLYKIYSKRNKLGIKVIYKKNRENIGIRSTDSVTHLIQDTEESKKEMEEE